MNIPSERPVYKLFEIIFAYSEIINGLICIKNNNNEKKYFLNKELDYETIKRI